MPEINLSRFVCLFCINSDTCLAEKEKKCRKEACFYNGTPGAWNAGYPAATESPANMC